MSKEHRTYIEHVASIENADGSFSYAIDLDGTKFAPTGRFDTANEAWKAGYAELARLKGDSEPTLVDRLIAKLKAK